MPKLEVGEMVVLKGSDALKLWDRQDSPDAVGFCSALVVGQDEQGRPIIDLWGKTFPINPDLIVDQE